MDDLTAKTWVARSPIAADALTIIASQERNGGGCKLLCGLRGCGWPHASESFPLYQLGEGEVKRVTAMHTAMQDVTVNAPPMRGAVHLGQGFLRRLAAGFAKIGSKSARVL